ncbi:MAG TPA: 5-deoxy-glucuronate isomerase, partial [Spirochaetales bacterium]|nr:5-deoxy-glucuronate isomerase [Spirochaetales bacterium]
KVCGPSLEDERAFLLARGTVEFTWTTKDSGGLDDAHTGKVRTGKATASRLNLFDESPAVLSVPAGVEVEIRALDGSGSRHDKGSKHGDDDNGANGGDKGGAELYVMATANPRYFEPRFYTPEECRSEERGKGTMNETSTRIVRTVFDDSNAPWSNLVVGEVITIPGKWSSYPPHHHPQPEIYHYRVLPEQGFGVAIIGEHPYVVTDRDTVLIRDGQDHPQVAAPGYALWYLWVVRHLDGNRYSNPIVTEAHKWVTDPNAKIWSFRR